MQIMRKSTLLFSSFHKQFSVYALCYINMLISVLIN